MYDRIGLTDRQTDNHSRDNVVMRHRVIIKSQLMPVCIANTQRHIYTSQLCIKDRMRLRQRSHASVAPTTLIAGVTAHPALQPNVFLERSSGESIVCAWYVLVLLGGGYD